MFMDSVKLGSGQLGGVRDHGFAFVNVAASHDSFAVLVKCDRKGMRNYARQRKRSLNRLFKNGGST